MNCCRETTKMGVPPGDRPAVPRDWFRGVPEWYAAGADTRGRQEGRPYPWSEQVIHEISGLITQYRLQASVKRQRTPGSCFTPAEAQEPCPLIHLNRETKVHAINFLFQEERCLPTCFQKNLCIPLEIEGFNYAGGARNKLGF
jgi:hypothetical protein